MTSVSRVSKGRFYNHLFPALPSHAGISSIFQVVFLQSATGRSGLFLSNGRSRFVSLVSTDLRDLQLHKYYPFGRRCSKPPSGNLSSCAPMSPVRKNNCMSRQDVVIPNPSLHFLFTFLNSTNLMLI